ncbi:MAG: hypothetical protein ACERLG_04385 [Sedimentibacter sp.]
MIEITEAVAEYVEFKVEDTVILLEDGINLKFQGTKKKTARAPASR